MDFGPALLYWDLFWLTFLKFLLDFHFKADKSLNYFEIGVRHQIETHLINFIYFGPYFDLRTWCDYYRSGLICNTSSFMQFNPNHNYWTIVLMLNVTSQLNNSLLTTGTWPLPNMLWCHDSQFFCHSHIPRHFICRWMASFKILYFF